jgi:hypothetical protein
MDMDQQKPNMKNNPANAMDEKKDVVSNDVKMKQDFPGFPHNPAGEDVLKPENNWRTDFSNESDTTATGSESVRGDRPTDKQNKTTESDKEFKSSNDRGLTMHDVDPNDPENDGEGS